MGLHTTDAPPDAAERAAVDAVLGPPESGWFGGQRTPLDGHVAIGGLSRARSLRHLLLPALHSLQERTGWISPPALGYLCQRLDLPLGPAPDLVDLPDHGIGRLVATGQEAQRTGLGGRHHQVRRRWATRHGRHHDGAAEHRPQVAGPPEACVPTGSRGGGHRSMVAASGTVVETGTGPGGWDRAAGPLPRRRREYPAGYRCCQHSTVEASAARRGPARGGGEDPGTSNSEESAVATVNVTKDRFEQLIEDHDTVLVDFWASWCGPCRMFGPIYEEASERYGDVVFAKVDTEAEQELAAAFGIRSIPTLMAFREKVLLYSQPGALPAKALEDLIGQVRALDMDEVHRKVAEQVEAQHAGAREGADRSA